MNRLRFPSLWCGLCCVTLALFAGCEKKESVIDVQAPGVDVKVDKVTEPDGEKGVDVDVNVGKKE